MIALWLALVAWAGPPADASSAEAEARRLSAELTRLEQRGAWDGAEEAYRDLVATGQPLSRDDQIHGAHAARARGDVAATWERVRAAAAAGEDQEVTDWLDELGRVYGPAHLTATTEVLTPDAMPFQPDRAIAVRFAADALQQTGTFDGFLPAGGYTLGTVRFEVRPARPPVQVELAEPPVPKRPRPPLLGVLAGAGAPYGAPVGLGLGVVVRPVPALGIAAAGGFDPEWGRPGVAGSVRFYPVNAVYLGAGVAPVAGGGSGSDRALALGPTGAAGVDLGVGLLRVDASLGGGVAWAGGRRFAALTAGVGVGISLGRSVPGAGG